jgi:DNA-directed RNA polymerase subunit H
MKEKVDITKHILIPKYAKVTEQEKQALFDKYNISFNELPFLFKNDPSLKELKVKEGDIIKVIRKSPTAGETVVYKGVVE